MINFFIGKTEPELLAYLKTAQDDLASGKNVTQAGAGDATVQERVEVSILNRIEQILGALNALNPVTYPAAQTKRVSRTKLVIYPWYDNIIQ